jgi:COP9 signalosome complex subunit 1
LVASYVSRAESGAESAVGVVDAGAGGNSSHKEAQAQRLAAAARLKAAAGLAELASHKYRNAARCFLQARALSPHDCLQIEMDHFSYPDLLTSRDVAVYGSLCALATYSRVDLQKHVLQNNVFKQFLELEPQLSELIRRFTESAYSKCLAIMAANRDRVSCPMPCHVMRQWHLQLSLDMYLSAHVNPLFEQIRRRGLVQYFSPFLSADMNLMAQAFQSTINEASDLSQ